MKNNAIIFCLAFLLSSTLLNAQEVKQAPAAADVLDEALVKARDQQKKVFLMFHASWCGWCHRMDSLMAHPDIKAAFHRNFVIAHLVVLESQKLKHLENPGAEEIRKGLRADQTGIPFWVIYDPAGNILADAFMRPGGEIRGAPGENTGCPATAEEVEHWIRVLKQTTDLKEAELETVVRLFKR